MKRALLLLPLLGLLPFAVPACAEDEPVLEDAGDEAFVRRVLPFVLGRRPLGLQEVRVLAEAVEGSTREAVVRALLDSDEAREHWRAVLFDQLGVHRIGVPSNRDCYALGTEAAAGPELAAHLAATDPVTAPFATPWTMRDLALSALRLDDLSPLFRAHLLTGIAWERPAQTLSEGLAYRQTTGEAVAKAYLGRDLGCLPCHNSEESVTGHADPERDRTWELPGPYEAALFPDRTGGEPERFWTLFRRYGVLPGYQYSVEVDFYDPPPDAGCVETYYPGCVGCACEGAVCDQDRSCCDDYWHAGCAELCRQSGEVVCGDPTHVAPWGVDRACGVLIHPELLQADIAGGDAYLAGEIGPAGSVWDVEALLAEGAASLLASGPPAAEGGELEGGRAMAYLLAAATADRVWFEAFGTRLTLQHGFPRNRAQRDRLAALADVFVRDGFSLASLVVAVTEDPLFNLKAPADGTPLPAELEPVFDPYTVEQEEASERPNRFGERLQPLPPRVLIRSVHAAMGWPQPLEFHGGFDGEESEAARLQEAMGVWLKQSSPGFRALTFQSALAWEDAVGACRDTAPRSWGCESNSYAGCADCPCEAEVCARMPECCTGRWFPECAEACAESDAGCGEEEPPPDFVDGLIEAAGPEAELRDGLAALKDRLLGEADLSDPEEVAVFEAVMEARLGDPLGAGSKPALRAACGVLLASPQLLLEGDAPVDGGEALPWEPPGQTRADACARLAPLLGELLPPGC